MFWVFAVVVQSGVCVSWLLCLLNCRSNYTDLSSLKMDPQHHVAFVPMSNTMHYQSKAHTQPLQHTNTLTQQYLSNLSYINPTYINNGPAHTGHTHTPTQLAYTLPTPNSLVPACCQQNNQMHQGKYAPTRRWREQSNQILAFSHNLMKITNRYLKCATTENVNAVYSSLCLTHIACLDTHTHTHTHTHSFIERKFG